MKIAGQIISIIAMVTIVLSFQMKSNRKLIIVQTIANIGFAISYIMLGAFNGAFSNFVSVFRGISFNFFLKRKSVLLLVIFELAYVGVCVYSYIGVLSVIILIASLVDTYSLWSNNGKRIRIMRAGVVSPLWLFYNIATFSIGGICCEVFNIISSIISFIKYKKDFEK